MPAKAGNPLTRKLGPAPVWVWGIALGVLILAYRALKGKGASTVTSPQAAQGSTVDTTGGAGTNGGSSAAGGGGTAADNLSADLLGQFGQALVDTNSSLVYGLMSTTGAVEGLGYGAFGLAGQTLDANLQLQQSILDKFTPSAMGSATSSPTTGGGSVSKGGQYAEAPWVASPYYSAAGVAQGAGPAPSPAAAASYSLGTLRGAGYGNNLSVL